MGGHMHKIAVGLASLCLTLAIEANAQSVSRVTSAVSGVGSTAGGATAGATASSPANGATNPTNGALTGATAGGSLPGALEFKAGDKVIQFRGAAGMGDDRGNFKAGLGIPF